LDVGEIFPLAGRKIIDAAYAFAARQQSPSQRRSDESANASDEIKCHGPFMITEQDESAMNAGVETFGASELGT
jgi:hypothetical protein